MAKAIELNDSNEFKVGDPYFCPECKRTHQKGKIYNEHLSYAQNQDNVEDVDIDTEEGNFVFDDESEDADVMNELEEDDLEDVEDREEEEFEEVSSRKTKEECVEAVEALPGVGEATLKKLIKAGFDSLESIAFTPPQIIKDESGMGDKTVAKLIKASMERLNIGFKSAEEVWEKRKNIAQILTGSSELDDLLGGGLETGSITEFYGEFRTGKTQIMHQLCVNVQLPPEQGGLEGRALYIDTEGTFRPERIVQMSEAKDLDAKKVLSNIIFGRAYNSDHQILLVKEAAKLVKEKNIKLIVVDSLIGHFRSEYVGRGTLANRQQFINTHLHDLMRLCDIYPDLAVAITNQVSSKPDVFYGNPTTHTGGHIVAHASTIRIYLRKGKGEQRIAKMVDAPHLPEAESVFSITEDGITD